MGRLSNYPDEIERLKCISISDLRKLGYLEPNVFLNKSIYWTNQNGDRTSSIAVIIDTNETKGSITFDYTYNQSQKINYTVQLMTRPSNLGNGLLWFFVCPSTFKVCRKLHLNCGYFLHRTAFSDLYYEKQLHSKRWREWDKSFGACLDDGVYEELHKKYFKKFYKGKPTKRYLKLMEKLNSRESIAFGDIEKFLL
ncbi:hypothetical protein H3Z85_03450 [Chryseobacterium indologenes]|uniref:hypothetical protein n=1 Tax=Chryseobacterium indologenes TaxID=253 RepID=UPI0003E06D55|nr:hypothetical protein [Chryseobacterium indologenes]MBF6643080.1 hypothetical protein [Chryseobacterium indologenes]QPQ52540.1 hypothetical protein H3Z85_03450 [Chryseobacterium indologenes]QQQ73040.1 hypothetical protein JHW31_10050 [Chryseobacterium indologenes]SFJ81322.1 hypothetical protein SAMN05421692_2584 [Chryseobacterium indologenes]SUX51210.1 Uncharacterised protein [Chryseobacterium indologenes]